MSNPRVEIHGNKRTITVSDDEHHVEDSGPIGFVDGLKDFLRPAILKPMQLIFMLFFFFHAASLTAMRPYMIEVFARLEVPLSPNVLTVSGRLNDRFHCEPEFRVPHVSGQRARTNAQYNCFIKKI